MLKYALLLSATIACLLTGCSGDGKVPVSGTVTWNGTPVEQGHLVFTPVDPSVTPDGTKIADGKFACRAIPGEKKIEIYADHAVGKPDPVMNLQRYEPYIPVRYNEQSELTVTVEASGDNALTFDLVGKKGDKIPGSGVATSLP